MSRTRVSLASVLFLCGLPAFAQGPERHRVVPDAWSPKIDWRAPDGWYSVAVHATLMPDGSVMCIGYERPNEIQGEKDPVRRAAFVMDPTPLGEVLPGEVVITPLVEPVDIADQFFPPYFVSDDLFCTGNTLTSDGAMFTAGGTRAIWDTRTNEIFVVGLSYATQFDGTTWSRIPADMLVSGGLEEPARWYPTPMRLPDERILVTGGYEVVYPDPAANLSAEVYDPATGEWEVLSDHGEPPFEIFNSDYTHSLVLPDPIGTFDVLMFGNAGVPVLMSLDAPATWFVSPAARPDTQFGQDPNNGASTTLLPLRVLNGEWGYNNGSALVSGGLHLTSHQSSADVFDPVAGAWTGRFDLGVPRHHPNSVLLPDGRILVAAGHNATGSSTIRRASYIDPAAGFHTFLGSSIAGEIRGYHTVALLLPDGRVLVGGGQGEVTGEEAEKSNFRYLYPSYVFADRPVIEVAPETVTLGLPFAVETDVEPSEFVLIGLGSMTHSFDTSQRYVQLNVQQTFPFQGGFTSIVDAPPDGRTAPPGHYMLFALDEKRIPSIAAIVHVGS